MVFLLDAYAVVLVETLHVEFAVEVHIRPHAVGTSTALNVFNVYAPVFVNIGRDDPIPTALADFTLGAARERRGRRLTLVAPRHAEARQYGEPCRSMREIAHV